MGVFNCEKSTNETIARVLFVHLQSQIQRHRIWVISHVQIPPLERSGGFKTWYKTLSWYIAAIVAEKAIKATRKT